MRLKYNYSILALFMAALIGVLSVSAADVEVTQNAGTKNIFVFGKINSDLLSSDGSEQITLMMVDKDADINKLSGAQINYINQFGVNADGTYAIKFKYAKDAAVSKMYLKYKNTVINSSVVSAVSSSQVIDGEVWLTSSDDRAYLSSGAYTAMPTYSYSRTIDGVTYEHRYTEPYTFDAKTGIKATVQLTNKFGFNEGFDVLIAFYDEGGSLKSCKIEHGNVPYGENGEISITETGAYEVPKGTAKAKAFVLSSLKEMTPYTEENDGALKKIHVYCIGDSTGQDWDEKSYPQAGWGTFIKDYFNTEYATFVNKCVSGSHAQAILGNENGHGYRKWQETMEAIEPGDYIIVSLGINDAYKEGPSGMSAVDWYKLGLNQMIYEARDKGVNIIMCSRIHGGYNLVDTGDSLKMIDAMKSVCTEKDVPFLNIFEYIENEFIKINDLDTVRKKYFLKRTTLMSSDDEFGFGLTEAEIKNHTNSNINYEKYDAENAANANDYTHTNIRGANLTCQAIAAELKKSNSNLRYYLK